MGNPMEPPRSIGADDRVSPLATRPPGPGPGR